MQNSFVSNSMSGFSENKFAVGTLHPSAATTAIVPVIRSPQDDVTTKMIHMFLDDLSSVPLTSELWRIILDYCEEEKTSTASSLTFFPKNVPNMAIESVKKNIKDSFSDFKVEDCEFLGEGFDSTAFLINGDWVFRFPKRVSISKALEVEIKLLPMLAKKLQVAIPDFTYMGIQKENGFRFVGYREIQGSELSKELFLSLPMVAQANVFRTLSHFLQTVHSFPVEQARRFGVAEDDVQKSYAEFWDENKDKIFPLLNREYQQRLEVAFQEYLGNPGNFQYKPSLLYADLAPEHILFNTKKAEIVGVIDWGDVIIGDPDFDLMYLYRYYGEDFLNSFLNYYQHQDREALLRKIKLFCVCDYIETILEPAYKRDQAQELHKLHEVLLDGWPLVNSSQPKLACA